jgi:hypothetical protein
MNYNDEDAYKIYIVYILFIIIWIIIVIFLKIHDNFIIVVPPIIFLYSIYCVKDMDPDMDLFQTSFIVVGIIFAVPLLTLLSDKKHINFNKSCNIISLAVIFILISYIPICKTENTLFIWKHCRSCMETISIILFIYVLLSFFCLSTC